MRRIAFLVVATNVQFMVKYSKKYVATGVWGFGAQVRHTAVGLALISALTAAQPALIRALALELAPVASTSSRPGSSIRRCRRRYLVTSWTRAARSSARRCRSDAPADIAALAVHLMTNTAVTGATYDIDGGQQLVEGLSPQRTLNLITEVRR